MDFNILNIERIPNEVDSFDKQGNLGYKYFREELLEALSDNVYITDYEMLQLYYDKCEEYFKGISLHNTK